jgi:hypothetical protein
MPAATDIAAMAARIRHHLPNNLFKASLPIFLLSIARPPAGGIAVGRRSRYRQGMLTIPPITSSFGASI